MEEINRNNYQAWFLDYIEGNLGENESSGLFAFLSAHPHLMEEFEELQSLDSADLKLPLADTVVADWSDLKDIPFQALLKEESARMQLYFRVIEAIAEEGDEALLFKLLGYSPGFLKEFDNWKRLQLVADENSFENKELLYKNQIGRPVNGNNFEEYCIALTEGLLNTEQQRELYSFADKDPNRQGTIQEYKNTRLSPEKGIFYPDKDKLYRKEKRAPLLPLYRIAIAIAAIFILMFLWFSPEDTSKPVKIADKPKITEPLDEAASTTKTKEEKAANERISTEIDTAPVQAVERTPVNKSKKNQSYPAVKTLEKIKKSTPQVEENMVKLETLEPANEPINKTAEEMEEEQEKLESPGEALADASDARGTGSVQYQKINEFAQDQLKQLVIGDPANPQNSNGNLLEKVKNVAEDVTGTRVDYKTAKPADEEEYLSYSIRIGGIKLSRSASR